MTLHDPAALAGRAALRQRQSRRRLLVFNASLGACLGQAAFTLLALGLSPRLHAALTELPLRGPLAASLDMALILMEPFFLWGGLVAAVLGGGLGVGVGAVQARLLERAGEIARGAELEKVVAARTVDLTLHNQRISELNASLRETRRHLEQRNRELREAQERLVRTERLAAVTETAVSVNHELNGPLMVILGQAELLLARGDTVPADEVSRRLRLIERQCLAMGEIVRRLAHLAEPVTTTYLEDEGIRMVDVDRSPTAAGAAQGPAAEPVPETPVAT